MATYKVWLTVKDSYGNIKEVEGGTINVDLATLTPDEVDQIEEVLPLEDFVTKKELDDYATDKEVVESIQNNEALRYGNFEFAE